MKLDIDEDSDKSVAEQLRDALSKAAVRVIDLFREWDDDGNGAIDKKEFRKAMPALGFSASKDEVDGLFDEWDAQAHLIRLIRVNHLISLIRVNQWPRVDCAN